MYPPEIESQLKALAENNLKISDIFEACPFDNGRNKDGAITPELFRKTMFVETMFDKTKGLNCKSAALMEALTSDQTNFRLIFLNGFSGCGKSTFIRFFLEDMPDFRSEYFDFNRMGRKKDIDPVSMVIRSSLLKKVDGDAELWEELKAFVKENENQLFDYLNDELREKIVGAFNLTVLEAVKLADEADLFILFFICIFLRQKEGEKCIFCFDNLDRVELAFLSNSFRKDFIDILDNVLELSTIGEFAAKKIGFTHNYKFVFCLRDASHAHINSHIISRMGRTHFLLDFNYDISDDFVQRMLKMRIDLIRHLQKHYAPFKDVSIIDTIETIVDYLAPDEFLNNAIVALYNNDVRGVIHALLDLGENEGIAESLRKTKGMLAVGDRDEEMRGSIRYAVRETILHWVIRDLIDNGFLGDDIFEIKNMENGSYCLLTRVLLTIMSNSVDPRERHSRIFRPTGTCSLHRVLREAGYGRIEPTKSVIENIVKMHECYKKNWASPITLEDVNVQDINYNGDTMIDAMVEAATECVDEEASADDRRKAQRLLKSIRIKVNPSGYALIRFILPSYEFYSNISKSEAGPIHLTWQDKGGKPKDVADHMQKVLTKVKWHVGLMKNQYEVKYVKGMRLTVDQFRKSRFAFRSDTDKIRGRFHFERICARHRQTLQFFEDYVQRRYGLDDPENKEVVEAVREMRREYSQLEQNTLTEIAGMEVTEK